MEANNHSSSSILPQFDSREISFLLLKWLQYLGIDSAKYVENELNEKGFLPNRLDIDGKSHSLSFDQLNEMNDHLEGNHIQHLLQRLILISHSKSPPPFPIFTLLGKEDYSLIKSKNIGDTSLSLSDYFPPSKSLNSSSQKKNAVNALQSLRRIGDRISPTKLIPPIYNYRQLKTVQGHRSPVYCLLLDKTGQRFVTGSDDRFVKVWSTRTGHLLRTLKGHAGDIVDLAVSEDNQILASACNSSVIRIWDFNNYHPITVLTLEDSSLSISSLNFCFGKEKNYLLSTDNGGGCQLWPVDRFSSNNCEVHSHVSMSGTISTVSVTKGGSRFITSGDSVIRIWGVEPLQCFGNLVHSDEVRSIEWNSESNRILSGGLDVRLWDYQQSEWKSLVLSFEELKDLTPPETHGSFATMVEWSRDDKFAIAAATGLVKTRKGEPLESKTFIKIWHSQSGKTKHTLTLHTDLVYVLEKHPTDDRVLLSAGYDGNVFLWDILEGTPLYRFKITGSSANPLDGALQPIDGSSRILDGKFSPDGSYFVLTDTEGKATIYGSADDSNYENTPKEQIFKSDNRSMRMDNAFNVIDEIDQIPVHLCDPGEICNFSGTPYPIQRKNEISIPQIDVDELKFNKQIQQEYWKKETSVSYKPENPIVGHHQVRVLEPIIYEDIDTNDNEEEFVDAPDDDEEEEDYEAAEEEEQYSNTRSQSHPRRNEGRRRRRRSRRTEKWEVMTKNLMKKSILKKKRKKWKSKITVKKKRKRRVMNLRSFKNPSKN
eukprot:TRINITY_DN1754_c0_g1_i1.p1 TRINITY_DN1754_c0_g1~~TRINITY_DN1754_c0_g1_i1.p1  ORF type:complete len:768 (+),score=248.51 TRINITY_DN1754_c0_g1_i1:28-2331(+)